MRSRELAQGVFFVFAIWFAYFTSLLNRNDYIHNIHCFTEMESSGEFDRSFSDLRAFFSKALWGSYIIQLREINMIIMIWNLSYYLL